MHIKIIFLTEFDSLKLEDCIEILSQMKNSINSTDKPREIHFDISNFALT